MRPILKGVLGSMIHYQVIHVNVMIDKHTFCFYKFFHKTRSHWVAGHVKEWLATYRHLGSREVSPFVKKECNF
jgi:hypothetical protein